MAYEFDNLPFKWTVSDGTPPTEQEIALGLQGGMALPASFVNQQWTATYLAIEEIQNLWETWAMVAMPDSLVTTNGVFGENIKVGKNIDVGEVNTYGTGSNFGDQECYVIGIGNRVYDLNLSVGKYCKTPTSTTRAGSTGDLFIIGNGLGDNDTSAVTMRSNAFRVTADGQVLGTQAYAASGADFAECFEWADGNPENEDRRGRFVTLDGEKIRLATAEDDYILGAVSATPTVIGDAHTDDWHGKYETDVFGVRVLENGAWKLTEGFDGSQDDNYTSRLKRAEWAAVGLVGKLVAVDDGSCQVNGYCKPSVNGIATASETGYRVMARLDETHIRVLVK